MALRIHVLSPTTTIDPQSSAIDCINIFMKDCVPLVDDVSLFVSLFEP